MEYYHLFNSTIRELFGGHFISEEPASQNAESETAKPGKESATQTLDESLIRLGDAYIHLKKIHSAKSCFREAIRINPRNSLAFNRLLLIPSFFIPHDNKSESKVKKGAPDKKTLGILSINDTFRQTFLGGYVVLSRDLEKLSRWYLHDIFRTIQNLDDAYFQSSGCKYRDYGKIKINRATYVWMINHLDTFMETPCSQIPVLIAMSNKEHKKLKALSPPC